ncbi:hypothetical protein N7540_008601 [Penicillium herquei]|nr:hypothetical protein N7540_008601 [Penicillium herquei]
MPTDVIAIDPDVHTEVEPYLLDDFQSETTSLASAIARGRMENGRRYQALKEDDYWSPSDEKQFEAFEMGPGLISISHMVCLMLEYESLTPLHRAPINESTKNILDIGTGKGSWAIITILILPKTATVRGVDLFPPPATWVPPNCVFEVDDIQREWTWKDKFDYIHIRQLLGSFSQNGWDNLYQNCYKNLEPGGWVEQTEFDIRVYSDDGSLPKDSVLSEWGHMFITCGERAGLPLTTQETMRGALKQAGFVDIQEKLYKVPMGPWPRDKVLKEVGLLNYHHWMVGLEGYAMWFLTNYGSPDPWTKDEVEVYLAKVRLDLRNTKYHGYGYARRVWARKPKQGETGKGKEPAR